MPACECGSFAKSQCTKWIGEAKKGSVQDGVGCGVGWEARRDTERGREAEEERMGPIIREERGSLFQAPSLPKAFLHPAPGL